MAVPISLVNARKAGFPLRVVATLIDAVILAIVGGILTALLDTTVASLLTFVIDVGYYIYFWGTTGQTIGHKLMNLRVIRTDGTPLTMGNAAMRYVGMVISIIPLFLGLLWVLFDANKQGWHDKIAGTYVVHV